MAPCGSAAAVPGAGLWSCVAAGASTAALTRKYKLKPQIRTATNRGMPIQASHRLGRLILPAIRTTSEGLDESLGGFWLPVWAMCITLLVFDRRIAPCQIARNCGSITVAKRNVSQAFVSKDRKKSEIGRAHV